MATFNKFYCFVQDVGRKVHNLNSDTLKIALTNSSPTAATNTVLADISQISAANGYSSGGTAIGSTGYSQSGGIAALTGNNVTFTASGGSMATFRYAVIYNSTASGSPLIAWVDYGSSITLAIGESLVVDLTTNTNILTVT
jgi:hypothetical protein